MAGPSGRVAAPVSLTGRIARAGVVQHKEWQVNRRRINVGYESHGAIVEDQPAAILIGGDYHVILRALFVVHYH